MSFKMTHVQKIDGDEASVEIEVLVQIGGDICEFTEATPPKVQAAAKALLQAVKEALDE